MKEEHGMKEEHAMKKEEVECGGGEGGGGGKEAEEGGGEEEEEEEEEEEAPRRRRGDAGWSGRKGSMPRAPAGHRAHTRTQMRSDADAPSSVEHTSSSSSIATADATAAATAAARSFPVASDAADAPWRHRRHRPLPPPDAAPDAAAPLPPRKCAMRCGFWSSPDSEDGLCSKCSVKVSSEQLAWHGALSRKHRRGSRQG